MVIDWWHVTLRAEDLHRRTPGWVWRVSIARPCGDVFIYTCGVAVCSKYWFFECLFFCAVTSAQISTRNMILPGSSSNFVSWPFSCAPRQWWLLCMRSGCGYTWRPSKLRLVGPSKFSERSTLRCRKPMFWRMCVHISWFPSVSGFGCLSISLDATLIYTPNTRTPAHPPTYTTIHCHTHGSRTRAHTHRHIILTVLYRRPGLVSNTFLAFDSLRHNSVLARYWVGRNTGYLPSNFQYTTLHFQCTAQYCASVRGAGRWQF